MSASLVKVNVRHARTGGFVPEKRYALGTTISAIKANLATHFPCPADKMRLSLVDLDGDMLDGDMQDDKPLGYYQCQDGFTIDVVDLQERAAITDFSDVSTVDKVTISEETYSKREESGRVFRERMVAAQRARMAAQGVEVPVELHQDSYKAAAEHIQVNDRCKVSPGDRLGIVKYVGRIAPLKPGFWIGVEFDEPVGKNDGTAGGIRIFPCQALHGGFLRPDQVEVGDFPPEEF